MPFRVDLCVTVRIRSFFLCAAQSQSKARQTARCQRLRWLALARRLIQFSMRLETMMGKTQAFRWSTESRTMSVRQ